MFKVSVKGIVEVGNSYLLRVNERGDYELLGGKLENQDRSFADRVRQEFLEESGVVVEPAEAREPWFYTFGNQAVLIVPLVCSVVSIPDVLFDQDGGRLEWVDEGRLGSIRLPKSYLASIRGERPSLTRHPSSPARVYADDRFCIELVARHAGEEQVYPVDEPCDLALRLQSLGYPEVRFHTVRYRKGSGIQMVYDCVL